MSDVNIELLELRSRLQGSFLTFIEFFYPIMTGGRPFLIGAPISRESHYISIARFMTKIFKLDPEYQYCIINMPPGHGKSTMTCYFIAWALSIYPDSRFPYISYGVTVATEMTALIRDIMNTYEYKTIFDVHVRRDFCGKEHFKTKNGGAVKAFGLEGAVTGFDAGLQGVERFSGMLIVDDPHKLTEVSSDPYRERTCRNFSDAADTRQRGKNVPTLIVCQPAHEDDLTARLIDGRDGRKWKLLSLPALDEHDHVLCDRIKSKEDLQRMREFEPYKFWTQYQMQRMPAGGALFKRDNFVILDKEPEILCTFITADTAETNKSYNDKTVFSFWGYYKIQKIDEKNFLYGLHWIDCVELSVEPKDLEDAFMDFWHMTCRYKVQPYFAAIEKKSTGSTLISILQKLRGLHIREIERGSREHKGQRFLDAQPIAYRKLISFPAANKHADMCIKHMEKITINDTHRWDDIADTFADAVRIAFIDKTLQYSDDSSSEIDDFLKKMSQANSKRNMTIQRANAHVSNFGVHR